MAISQRSTNSAYRGRSRRMMSDINVVPYIDVMLVLLIIFMVAAPMINPGTVDLPSVAKTSAPPTMPIEVQLQANGKLSVRVRGADGISEKNVSKMNLAVIVARLQTEKPERAVVLAADKAVRYELIMQTLSSLQKNNIQKIGLLVNPEAAVPSVTPSSEE